MSEQTNPTQTETDAPAANPTVHIAPGPHFGQSGRSTRWMMLDVILGLVPAVIVAHLVFGLDAARVIGLSVIACILSEALWQAVRGRGLTVTDGSALVTGLILALSLPWTSPWYVPVIGGVVAIVIGKMVFGGLGQNIFNPAMVGRAFLMISFAKEMTDWGLVGDATPPGAVAALSGATPLAAKADYVLSNLFLGNIGGSLGETSALALLIGGLYLCVRRSAAWQIPAGTLLGALVAAFIAYAVSPGAWTPLHHLTSGALMLGAFFIATDPASTPVSRKGRWVFGAGFGALTVLMRTVSSYPEWVMFSILVMNALTPLINRWTIPRPVGGPTKAPATA